MTPVGVVTSRTDDPSELVPALWLVEFDGGGDDVPADVEGESDCHAMERGAVSWPVPQVEVDEVVGDHGPEQGGVDQGVE